MNKTQQLKLGWLFPYSGIFRRLRTDLEQGLALGWGDGNDSTTLVPYPAFIQTGSMKDSEDALKKMLLYDEVDLIIGVIGTKVAYNLIPLLEKQQTPLIMLNLGADIPTRQLSSPYLFYNSLHLWKSEWVMGKWAQKKYGGEPCIGMSAYEGGYGLLEAFKAGTAASGAETVKLNIVRNFSPMPDVSPLIQYLRVLRPPHAHALLSGKEGELFLQLFREQGLDIPLTVNPFMAEDGLLPPDASIYSAVTWTEELDTPLNRQFVENYHARYDEHPHAFTLLAYETGKILASAVGTIKGRTNRKSLTEAIGKLFLTGPRGEISLSTCPLRTDMPVYIRQSDNKIIASATGIEWDDPSLVNDQGPSTGWQNPYLCV